MTTDWHEVDEAWRRACRNDDNLNRFDAPAQADQLVSAVTSRIVAKSKTPPNAVLRGFAVGFATISWETNPEAVYSQLSTLVRVAADLPGASHLDAIDVLSILGEGAASLLLEVWRSQAEKDQLTGLGNRRALETTAVGLKAAQHSFQYASIDVDGLKIVNDGDGGHEAGDQLLRVVAQQLNEHLKAVGAKVHRHGGDEFSVLLPSSDVHQNLQALIEEVSASLPNSISFSFGTATWPSDDDDIETVFSRADKSMYDQKNAKKGSRGDS